MITSDPVQLIKQVQCGTAEEQLLPSVKAVFSQKKTPEYTAQLRTVFFLLVREKLRAAIKYVIRDHKDFLSLEAEKLFDCWKVLISEQEDLAIRVFSTVQLPWDSQESTVFNHPFLVNALNYKKITLLTAMLANDPNGAFHNYLQRMLPMNISWVGNAEMFALFKQHGLLMPETIDLNRTQMAAIDDEVLGLLFKGNYFIIGKNTRITAIAAILIWHDKVVALQAFYRCRHIGKEKLFDLISFSNNLLLIRSEKMYQLVSELCPPINENYLDRYFLVLCNSSLHITRELVNCKKNNPSAMDAMLEKWFSETMPLLQFAERQLERKPPEFTEDFQADTEHFHYLALSAARHGFPHLVKFFFTQPVIAHLPDKIVRQALDFCYQHERVFVEYFIRSLPLEHKVLKECIQEHVSGMYSSYIPLILECHGDALLASGKITKHIISARIARAFKDRKFVFQPEQDAQFSALEAIQNQEQDEKTSHQQEFEQAVDEMVAQVVWAIQNGAFSLLPVSQPAERSVANHSVFRHHNPKLPLLDLNQLGCLWRTLVKVSGIPQHALCGVSRMDRQEPGFTFIDTRSALDMVDFLPGDPSEEKAPGLEYKGFEVSDTGAFCVNSLIHGSIGVKILPLTSTGLHQGRASWIHSQSDISKYVIEYTEWLIFDLLRNIDRRALPLSQHIATIHWWLAHASYFFRDSDVINEIVIRALFYCCNLRAGWSCSPDRLALAEPQLERFVNTYRKITAIEVMPERKEAFQLIL